jgi:hypothetical protein
LERPRSRDAIAGGARTVLRELVAQLRVLRRIDAL